MKPNGSRRGRGRRGHAAVELAVTLPLLATLVSGLLEVGRIIEVQQAVYSAAREAARQAATGQYTNAQVQAIALNNLKVYLGDAAGTMTANATVQVSDLTAPGSDASTALTLDQIQVTVNVPYRDVRWVRLPLVTSDATILSNSVCWSVLIDTPYPTVLPQPPAG